MGTVWEARVALVATDWNEVAEVSLVPNYSLDALTTERLELIAAEWRSVAGDDEFESELSLLFEWCGDHLEPVPHDAHALALVLSDDGHTHAIVEVIDTRRGEMTKLLKIWVSPEMWNADGDPVVIKKVVGLFGGVVIQTINRGFANGFNEIKMYGRNEPLLSILKALADQWGTIGTNWTAIMQGRWLSIRR